MKVTGWSQKVQEFMDKYSDIPDMSEKGILIHILDIDGNLRIAMDIGEEARSEALRETIPLALEWRNRLIDYQGKTGFYSNELLIKAIEDDYQNSKQSFGLLRKLTYQNITDALNQVVEDWLYEYLNVTDRSKSEISPYKVKLNFYLNWSSESYPNQLDRVKVLLKTFRINENGIDFFIDTGIDRITNGETPFLYGPPIIRE